MKHGDCAYFVDGMCTLYRIRVPADGPACPNFRPRTAVPQPPRSWSWATPSASFRGFGYWAYPMVPFGGRMGLGLRRRRRMRHRRGWRFLER